MVRAASSFSFLVFVSVRFPLLFSLSLLIDKVSFLSLHGVQRHPSAYTQVVYIVRSTGTRLLPRIALSCSLRLLRSFFRSSHFLVFLVCSSQHTLRVINRVPRIVLPFPKASTPCIFL